MPGSAWFTVERLDGDTFAISEYGHWEETHCYLLCGQTGALLIDTGLGVASIRPVAEALTTLPIQVATTHAHWDHIGSHADFSKIAVHALEADWVAGHFPLSLPAVKQNLTARPCLFPDGFSLDGYQIYQGGATRLLADGDTFSLGGRTVRVLHTPGHSPGHCCFYEPERRYLYSGDLIYQGCLDAFYPTTDPESFFRSVKRVRALPVARVLPGHHQLDIPVEIIRQVGDAFASLSIAGKLKQGGGLFSFGEIQIHI